MPVLFFFVFRFFSSCQSVWVVARCCAESKCVCVKSLGAEWQHVLISNIILGLTITITENGGDLRAVSVRNICVAWLTLVQIKLYLFVILLNWARNAECKYWHRILEGDSHRSCCSEHNLIVAVIHTLRTESYMWTKVADVSRLLSVLDLVSDTFQCGWQQVPLTSAPMTSANTGVDISAEVVFLLNTLLGMFCFLIVSRWITCSITHFIYLLYKISPNKFEFNNDNVYSDHKDHKHTENLYSLIYFGFHSTFDL